jgi:integrase/recombinase XerC
MREYLGGQEALISIDPSRLEAWAEDLRGKKYCSVSIRRKFATARVFFSYWVRRGNITSSPLWRIRLDLGRERVLPRSLSPADAKKFIEEAWNGVDLGAAPSKNSRDEHFLRLRNLAAIEVLFATGMRVGELVSLKTGDWHEDEASFLVNGKGSRQRLAFLPDERSLKAVRAYLAQRSVLSPGTDAFLLNSLGQRITTQGISRVITSTAKSAGISTKMTPHMVRHTVATLLLRYGADIRVVQEVLGHASIATTQRYTHITKDHLLSTLRARHPSYHLSIELKRAS